MNKLIVQFRRCIFLALFFVIANTLFAQQADWKKVDSMKVLLPKTTGEAKYPLYFGMAYELFDVDNQKAVLYADSAYSLIKSTPDSAEMVKSGRLYGQLLRRVNKLDEAITQFNNVLPIAQRQRIIREEKSILHALALAYNYKAEYDKSLEINLRSLELRELEGNSEEIANSLMNIAAVYYRIDNIDRALQFNNRALTSMRQLDQPEYLDQVLINISLCYIYLGDNKRAKQFIDEGLALCNGHCPDNVKANAEYSLGRYFENSKNHNEAKMHFIKSYEIAAGSGDGRYMAENSLRLGRLYLAESKFGEAEIKLKEAERLSSDQGYNRTLESTYLLMSRLYSQVNDCEKSRAYQEKYININDKIFFKGMIANMSELQLAYEERENRELIKAQAENINLKDTIISRQRQMQIFSVAIVVLLLVIGILLYRLSRSQVRANRELDFKVRERTQQMTDGNSKLQLLLNDQSRFIDRLKEDLLSFAASFNGLSQLIQVEAKLDAGSVYLKEHQILNNKLTNIITQLRKTD